MPLPGPFLCAPMAEITTPALRRIIREYSGGVTLYSEMLLSGALVSRAPHNEPLVQRHGFDDPFIYQIVGNSPAVMAEAARLLADRGPYGIDINMGCAAPDIVKTGSGAGLLGNPPLARDIVRACRAAVKCSLSVKMRSGVEESDADRLVDFAGMLEGEGVDFITLHPRHSRLGFRRSADWKLIRKVKQCLRIPVVGNGDVTGPASALRMMSETGCDGVMIGREVVKSPWIFRLCEDAVEKRSSRLIIDLRDVFLAALEHMALYLPERLHKSRAHRFCSYFSKNVHFSHDLFTRIRREISIAGMKQAVADYYERNPEETVKTISCGGEADEAFKV